ncbi:MAG: zf-HC2 domain-containing protein [Paludibaculum sp.]
MKLIATLSMHCGQVESLSDGFVDGDLAAMESLAVEKHLQDCAYCRDRIEDKRRWKQRLRDSVKSMTVPASLLLSVRGRIRCAAAN